MSSAKRSVSIPWVPFILICLATLTSCRSESENAKPAEDVRMPTLSYSSSGGCGNIFLYAGSEDQMEWLTVMADRRQLGFATATTSYDLAADSLALQVCVYLLGKPGDPEYCNDAPMERHSPTAVWKAQAGRITITLIGAQEWFKGAGEDDYTARVRLDSCVFSDDEGRLSHQSVPIEMEARVGWMAG